MAHDAATGTTGDEAMPRAPAASLRSLRPVRALPATIGRYRLLAEIGAGGMGIVYRAEQLDTGQTVAVKLLTGGATGDVNRSRLRRELQALLLLRHPGIAHLYDAGLAEIAGAEVPFLATELVPGLPLLTWTRAANPTLRARIELLIAICEAVAAAHRRGVIHLDLKPDNILVELDEAPRPRILDFGIARLPGDAADHGARIGTRAYMSPEQLAGAPDLGPPSDVHALGVIADELCADAPHSPGGQRPSQGDLQLVIEKARHASLDERYPTVQALAADLEAVLALRPVSIRPATALYRARCFARRDPRRFASLALATTATTLALVLGWSLAANRQRERDSALGIALFSAREITGQLRNLAGTNAVRLEGLLGIQHRVAELLALSPEDSTALDCQTEILEQLGDVMLERGDVAASLDYRMTCLAKARRGYDGLPPTKRSRGRLATLEVLIGDCHRALGHRGSAAESYERTHAEFAALAAEYPEDGTCLDDLAWSCDRLAHFAIEDGRFGDAEALLHQRSDLLDRLEIVNPDSEYNLSGRRALLCLLGYLEEARGNPAGQVHYIQLAIEPARQRLARLPTSKSAMLEFASTVLNYVEYGGDLLTLAERQRTLEPIRAKLAEFLQAEPDFGSASEQLKTVDELIAGRPPYGSAAYPGAAKRAEFLRAGAAAAAADTIRRAEATEASTQRHER